MRYQEQMKELLKSLGLGYGIGSVISIVLGILFCGALNGEALLTALALLIILGSAISVFTVARKKMAFAVVYSACGNLMRSGFNFVISNMFGSALGMALFIIPLIFFACLTVFMIMYLIASFPITIIYIIVMYLIEKFAGEIPDAVADWLDKIVPVASGIVTILLCKAMFF